MKSIKVTILGKQYPLKVNDEDEEMMQEIARYVDKRFQEFRKAFINQAEPTIMVLASLSIAEELFLNNGGSAPDPQVSPKAIFSEINTSIRQILDDIEHNNSDI